MTEQNNAAQAAHIDALQDLRVGVEMDRHHLPDGDAKLAALDAAISLLRAPVANSVQWPTMPPSKGQSHVLFDDGFAEGWAKCMDECRRAVSTASAPVAGEALAVVYPPDGTESPFTVINLGAGAVRMGPCIHDGRIGALWFGKGGQGMGHEWVLNRQAHPGETIAVVTFANADGLDVMLGELLRCREKYFPDAAPQASATDFAKLQSAYVAASDRIGELLAEKQASAENAPVAGEAQPVCWIEKDVLESVRDESSDAWVYWRPAGHVAEHDEMPLYAAPLASAGDARRALGGYQTDSFRALKTHPTPAVAKNGAEARKPVMTLAEFCEEADRIGLTADTLAAQLAARPEFADCLPQAGDGGAGSAKGSEDVALPPLPSPPQHRGHAMFAGSQMLAYARAAVLADRQQRAARTGTDEEGM